MLSYQAQPAGITVWQDSPGEELGKVLRCSCMVPVQRTGFERSARMGLWIQTMWSAHAELRPTLLQQLHQLTNVGLWQKRLAAALSAAGRSGAPPSALQACPHQGGPCPVFLLPDVVIKFFCEVGFSGPCHSAKGWCPVSMSRGG